MKNVHLLIKRIMDIFGSFFAILLLSPVMLLVALMVRRKLGSPVIFTHERPGKQGKPFKMMKFRTMLNTTDDQGKLLPNEERHTPFGKKLRSMSLDELPELFNVLKGEMSLVGPRPLLMEYLPLYNPQQMRRHEVPPGITGWAQINGRNAISWEKKFELDVWYVEHFNLLLDLKILWLTLWKVIRREGVNQSSEVTMEKFRGSESVKGNEKGEGKMDCEGR